jgi:DNA-binding protein HU-beta
MTKKRIVEELKNENVANADAVYDAVMESIKNVLMADGEVSLNGIGKLKIKDKPARKGRNPKTGATIDISATRVVKFGVAKALKEAVK